MISMSCRLAATPCALRYAPCSMRHALCAYNPMKESKKTKVKLGMGILIGVLFLYVAFRRVDAPQMWQALTMAHYWYLLPAVVAGFLSHYLRALRWRYLLDPIRRLDTGALFSSLMIGYAANAVVPAHLGEFLRAFVLSKKRRITMSAAFATIVVERILDVFSLLALTVLAIFLYPFPAWVIKSGYIMFGGTLGLFLFLVLLKKATSPTMRLLAFMMKPLPGAFERKMQSLLEEFLSGMAPLRRWRDYVTVGVLSVFIWACYGLIYHFCLHAFDFYVAFQLNWSVNLILLVMTTIAVVVPSSPGYVGTYHYLCQMALAMYGVQAGPALSFALVAHGVSVFPVLIVGLVLAHYEGMAIFKMPENKGV